MTNRTSTTAAIVAVVALAPAIATPAASATVGVGQIATQQTRDTHVQTVQYGTPRGVSIPRVWDNKLAEGQNSRANHDATGGPGGTLMILPIIFALLPVAFVLMMTGRELRPWWRQLQQIRALPERSEVTAEIKAK